MTIPNWGLVLLGVVFFQILKSCWLIFEAEVKKRREKKILKLVRVQFPDASNITYVVMDSSDKRSFTRMVDQIKRHFDIHDDEIEGVHEELGDFGEPPFRNIPKPKTSNPGKEQS